MRKPITVAVAALFAVLGACGGSGSDGDTNDASNGTTVTTLAGAEATLTADANDASQAALVTALEAHGVPSASRWAREIEEYRPYPTNDPELAKLQQNLAKYNPGSAVLAKILESLTV